MLVRGMAIHEDQDAGVVVSGQPDAPNADFFVVPVIRDVEPWDGTECISDCPVAEPLDVLLGNDRHGSRRLPGALDAFGGSEHHRDLFKEEVLGNCSGFRVIRRGRVGAISLGREKQDDRDPEDKKSAKPSCVDHGKALVS